MPDRKSGNGRDGVDSVAEWREVTGSGYQLYAADMANRCQQIKKLKGDRFTLQEIKQRLS
jgi:DNA-binding transcriptional MerR regulator